MGHLLHRRPAGWSKVANAQTRHVLTGIQWTICEKLGHWNPDMVAELKINEVALTSIMKSIIAYSIAQGATSISRIRSIDSSIGIAW